MARPTSFSGYLSLLFLALICRKVVGRATDPLCQGSPIDFIPDKIGGRATISLPPALLNLTLRVEMQSRYRDGIWVLKLPVLASEKKCITYLSDVHLCFQYSEVHWGKTNEEGSDHSINGYNYPMEIQHYFHRTNSTHSLTPLAVGVLFLDEVTYFKEESLSDAREKMKEYLVRHKYTIILEEREILKIHLGSLLPNNLEPFYQYSGPVSGTCGADIHWIVFKDPLPVYSSFLEILRSLGEKDDRNHFQKYLGDSCFLYSNYSSEGREETCRIGETTVERMPVDGSTQDADDKHSPEARGGSWKKRLSSRMKDIVADAVGAFGAGVAVKVVSDKMDESAKKDNSTDVSAKKDNSTDVSAKKDNSTDVSAKKDNSTDVSAKKDNSTDVSAKKDNSTDVSAKKEESTAVSAKKEESTAVSAKKEDSSAVSAKKYSSAEKVNGTGLLVLMLSLLIHWNEFNLMY